MKSGGRGESYTWFLSFEYSLMKHTKRMKLMNHWFFDVSITNS